MRIWGLRSPVLIALSALIGVSWSLAASGRTARVVGRVLVCNTPTNCLTRDFTVSAEKAGGHTVGHTTAMGLRNRYVLRLPPGAYELVAVSSGLRCQASATASVRHTTHQNIPCLVP